MDIRNRPSALLIALAAGTLLVAGCDQRSPTGPTAAKTDRSVTTAGTTTATPSNTATAPSNTATTTPSNTATSSNSASSTTDKIATATDDAAITAKVKAAILAEPGLKSLQINVDTNAATVTLTGSVDNADLRERAKQIASSTSGVKNVVDQLSVKSS